jgi:lysophospholipase L1-like esterase
MNTQSNTARTMKRHTALLSPLAALLLLATATPAFCAGIQVKSGEKIAFLGDSITASGWSNPAGYVRLVMAGLAANGVQAEAIPAGVGGNKSNQMLARLEQDVISKKPQWMALSCGVNDIIGRKGGVPFDDAEAAAKTYIKYKEDEPSKGTFVRNVTAMMKQVKAAGIRPVLLTVTVIQEDLNGGDNQTLVHFNDFLRKLGREEKIPVADVNALFQDRLRAVNTPNVKVLTTDGVHMKVEGNRLMAIGVLRAFGLNKKELGKAEAAWAPLIAQAKDAEEKTAKAAAGAAGK